MTLVGSRGLWHALFRDPAAHGGQKQQGRCNVEDAHTHAQIADVVRTYVEGMCQNDPAKLRAAMHEKACSIGHFEGGLEWEGREGFIGIVDAATQEPDPSPWHAINAISVIGDGRHRRKHKGDRRMKLPVRTKNAAMLGNGLIAHVRKVQEFRNKHGKLPQRPYLTYTQLVEQTGTKLAMVGIGNPLDEVMTAVHGPGVPEKMRGLTMFVRPKNGEIAYGSGNHDWRGIDAKNVMQYRSAVLEQDWTDVAFVSENET